MINVVALFVLALSFHSVAGNPYPRSPDPRLTPGALCTQATTYRYPERIAYCERDVNTYTKELVFQSYRKLGFSLSGDRGEYKVDHFIPLCLGGANDESNLWPQYYTISERTDPVEPLACEVLARGKMKQKDLVELVRPAKMDLSQVPAVLKQLQRL